MDFILEYFPFILSFVIILVASFHLGKIVLNVKLPLITGFLFTGIIVGPFALDLISTVAVQKLNFVNDLSLAFIAFAAGTELYLKELDGKMKSIGWNTFGQLVITFLMVSAAVFFMADFIPFMKTLNTSTRIAISILTATIFVARSPSSAIAVINELRAKGPFVQVAMGVTVVKDVLVVILFAVCFSLSGTLIKGTDFELMVFVELGLGLFLSFALGYIVGKVMEGILSISMPVAVKTIVILGLGFGVYLFSDFFKHFCEDQFHLHLHIEPLLICILGSFYVTNYTGHRLLLHKIIEETGPLIYVAFFTLIGAGMELDVLAQVWQFAVVLFLVRLLSMIIASFVGGALAQDPPLFRKIGWMPYVTQAGVALGLATIIANAYPAWGKDLQTIIIAVIVLNQIVGPPLFKWSISRVGESHAQAQTPKFDGVRDALIFGLESQSLALARQLKDHGWNATIATRMENPHNDENSDINIVTIKDLSKETFELLEAGRAEAIVAMLKDENSFKVCEMAYEHYGTKDIVVRLNNRENFDKFHELGALIVEPSTAIVSLMDNYVRSPMATSLLLGRKDGQETLDVELLDPELSNKMLKDIRLPSDILILSISRNGSTIITHGFTQLLLGDTLTLVGSRESLEKVRIQFSALSNNNPT